MPKCLNTEEEIVHSINSSPWKLLIYCIFCILSMYNYICDIYVAMAFIFKSLKRNPLKITQNILNLDSLWENLFFFLTFLPEYENGFEEQG